MTSEIRCGSAEDESVASITVRGGACARPSSLAASPLTRVPALPSPLAPSSIPAFEKARLPKSRPDYPCHHDRVTHDSGYRIPDRDDCPRRPVRQDSAGSTGYRPDWHGPVRSARAHPTTWVRLT